jgi:hypothetical protein
VVAIAVVVLLGSTTPAVAVAVVAVLKNSTVIVRAEAETVANEF